MATNLEVYLYIKSYIHTHTVVLPLESMDVKLAVGRRLHVIRKPFRVVLHLPCFFWSSKHELKDYFSNYGIPHTCIPLLAVHFSFFTNHLSVYLPIVDISYLVCRSTMLFQMPFKIPLCKTFSDYRNYKKYC